MTEELITYSTAVLAKEKNANLISPGFYDENKELIDDIEGLPSWYREKYIQAPTQYLLQRWLREIHKIHIEIFYMDELLMYGYKLTNTFTNTEYEEDFEYSSLRNEQGFIKGFSYEECLEAALCQALNLI